MADRYELQAVKDGWWVIRVPPKGRKVRLALYKQREQAEAHREKKKLEAEFGKDLAELAKVYAKKFEREMARRAP